MKHYGNVDLQNNFAQQLRLESETSFPTDISRMTGRLVFKDKRLYICAEIAAGLPVWIPLTPEVDTYVHHQPVASTTWVITHNLNTTSPIVQVYSDTDMLIPDAVHIIDNNTVQVHLGFATTGRAVVMMGALSGLAKSPVSFEYTTTTASTTWVIEHYLGYYPIVRVFTDTNEEILPMSIVHDSLFQTTITFSTARTGTARLM